MATRRPDKYEGEHDERYHTRDRKVADHTLCGKYLRYQTNSKSQSYDRRLDSTEHRVNCPGCLAALARPLTDAEALAWARQRVAENLVAKAISDGGGFFPHKVRRAYADGMFDTSAAVLAEIELLRSYSIG